jgi:hypothetical protein
MVKLNELKQQAMVNSKEAMEELSLDLNIMAIYSWRDKIVNAHIVERKTADYAAVMKIDWKQREYRSAVNIQMERIAKLGKK